MSMHNMVASLQGRMYIEMRAKATAASVNVIHIPENRARALDETHINTMMEEIDKHGLIQPIGIRVLREDERESLHAAGKLNYSYVLVFGAHRLAAWQRFYARDEEAGEEALQKTRWSMIPTIIYGKELTERTERVIELTENLVRKELTKPERDRMTAEVLELMVEEKPPNTKNRQAAKTANGGNTTDTPGGNFKPPTKKEVIATLKAPSRTFEREFKTYQQETGIKTHWTKLTKEQYEGFIQWFRDRAARAEKEEAKEKEEKERKEAEKLDKEFEQHVTQLRQLVLEMVGLRDNATMQKMLIDFAEELGA